MLFRSYLVDQEGNATYNESLEAQVQFARVGERYCEGLFEWLREKNGVSYCEIAF